MPVDREAMVALRKLSGKLPNTREALALCMMAAFGGPAGLAEELRNEYDQGTIGGSTRKDILKLTVNLMEVTGVSDAEPEAEDIEALAEQLAGSQWGGDELE